MLKIAWLFVMGALFLFLAFKMTAISYGPARKGSVKFPPNMVARVGFGLIGLTPIVRGILFMLRK